MDTSRTPTPEPLDYNDNLESAATAPLDFDGEEPDFPAALLSTNQSRNTPETQRDGLAFPTATSLSGDQAFTDATAPLPTFVAALAALPSQSTETALSGDPALTDETLSPLPVQLPPPAAATAPTLPSQNTVTVDTRSGRKRTVRNMDDLLLCICGQSAKPTDSHAAGDVARCKREGCETKWYHVDCIEPEIASDSWVCKPCRAASTREGKKRRTTRR
ncbi:hypothetical protein B0H14DRAFT_438574 [Mycena olivaceomarginata]|nr:hypothetical protein B0H14DRAFT_438574 [Mycena olivaceomarginata]